MTNDSSPNKEKPDFSEPVWTYRGYSIKTSEFVTAMVHFFRAEVARANTWRMRLDTTTNWAVVATGATMSLAFGQSGSHHAVIILNTLLVSLFLYIEARRYRYYELWSYRVRLMETDFYAAMLVPPFQPAPDWAETLAENLLHPRHPISIWEAVGRRLRRNYLVMFIILGISWFVKIWLFPFPAQTLTELISRGSIGPLQGWFVLTVGISFYSLLALMGLLTIGMHRATGEVLPRFGMDSISDFRRTDVQGKGVQAWYRPQRRRRQLLAFIVTNEDKTEEISQAIMESMKRGVTAFSGKGMYTGEERSILMCALTVTEVNNLKTVVSKIDHSALVVATNASDIFGKGFAPLEEIKKK